jgi:hypothetical protein
MPKAHLKLLTPTTENRTVTPKRLPNADLRTREPTVRYTAIALRAAPEAL